jgi:hypothetical protein
MALVADRIVMSDSSELGPIDPQITLADGRGNAIPHPVMSYLEAYKSHSDALRMNPNDVVAQIMLNKLEPATVNLFDAAKKRAQKLAEVHLNRWMFHSKKANYTKIASNLMVNTRWLPHGQMIGYREMQHSPRSPIGAMAAHERGQVAEIAGRDAETRSLERNVNLLQ